MSIEGYAYSGFDMDWIEESEMGWIRGWMPGVGLSAYTCLVLA